MPRAKTAVPKKRRRKKILKLAKGYHGKRSRTYRYAKQTLIKALVYAYRDRKAKKREFRKLWITRISAACKMNGISYSKFMNALKKANIRLDRKVLAQIAIEDSEGFKKIVEESKNYIAVK